MTQSYWNKLSILSVAVSSFFLSNVQAGIPLWTFSPPTPSIAAVSPGNTATIQYTITNQSFAAKNLIVRYPLVVNASPCYLPHKGSSCSLSLTISGNSIPKEGIHTGPILCEQGNFNQCYQPANGNQLNIQRDNGYSIGGGYIGNLIGSGLVLANGNDTLNIAPGANSFQFKMNLPNGSPYNVVIASQPTGQKCSVTNGSGTINNSNVTNISVSCRNFNYAYVTEYANNPGHIALCSLSASGALYNCGYANNAPQGTFTNTTFGTVNGVNYAYIIVNSGFVYQCSLNASGSFNVCNQTPASSAPLGELSNIIFTYVFGTQYAYLADYSTKTVLQCSLNADGSFNVCNNSAAYISSLGRPLGVASAVVNGLQYIYVVDDKQMVNQCSLNADGSLNTCHVITSPGITPADLSYITFATTNKGVQYAYLSDISSNIIYQCSLNADGSFNSCNNATNFTFNGPIGITFGNTSGVPYVYVASLGDLNRNGTIYHGIVYQCNFDSDGSFSACAASPANGTGVASAGGVALN